MEITPIIMNKNFIKLGLIENYKSLIWTSRYYDAGDFELCVNVNSIAIEFLQIGNYVLRDDDDNVGIIETLQIQLNEDSEEIIIASGRFATSLLSRRIIAAQTNFTNQYVSAIINKLLTDNVINPLLPDRKISNFVSGVAVNSGQRISTQYTGQNLGETISKLCQTYGLGYKVTFNNSNQFVFQLYEGEDRSYDQSINSYVVFSEEYDNLISSEYEENHQCVITDVLVAGEGEGTDRKTAWVSSNSASGIDRYEHYKDARDLSTNEGEISENEYNLQLASRGAEDITDYTTAFSGTADFTGVKYKQDVNLGDIVVVENSRWGISMNCRLVEVIESIDESGAYTINPTFGE